MNYFLNELDRNYSELSDKTAVKYSSSDERMTYGQLDICTGRLYGYLKENGVGKESVVLIHMKRSIRAIAAMVGVWKSGGAFVLCDYGMPEERVSCIASESGACLTIDDRLWDEIKGRESLRGRETVSPHDAAYILYTSGSTGSPKGIIHEYGNLDESAKGNLMLSGKPHVISGDVLAINSPLSVAASLDNICKAFNQGATLLLMDMADVRDRDKLVSTYEKEGVTMTFMTPSFFKACGKFGQGMKAIILGGETCSDIYDPDVRIYNAYSLSEAGRGLCIFPIDRKYALTPVGQNKAGEEILVLNEAGQKAAVGERGEFCFRNEYVRGYIGLPEKTAERWKGGLFHTGDLASYDEAGNITIHGRSDDMIKIGGMRIEPEEIEKAAKETLRLPWAAAKGFVLPDRSFVVLYYMGEDSMDANEAREKLMRRLPLYMVPTYFVRIAEAPLMPSGKLDRKRLEMPDVNNFRSTYAEPETPLQKKLRNLFEKILEQDHIGIDDDFYELGGDSLKSGMLVREAQMPEMDYSLIYRCRTVRRLAKELEYMTKVEDNELKDELARKKDILLNGAEREMFGAQTHFPDVAVSNLPFLFKMSAKDVDIERLVSALHCVINHHPSFKTVIRLSKDGMPYKHYYPDMADQISIEDVTEQQLMEMVPKLAYPFRIPDGEMYRVRVLKTENNVYLYLDICHAVADMFSISVIFENLSRAYHNGALERDYNYLISERTIEKETGETATIAAQYNELHYRSKTWTNNITNDHEPSGKCASTIAMPYGLDNRELKDFLRDKKTTVNALTIAASLLAIKKHEKKNDIFLTWMFHGRDSILSQNAVGFFIKKLPLGVSFDKIHTSDELIESVNTQIMKSIEMSADAYLFNNYCEGQETPYCVRSIGEMMTLTCIKGIHSEMIPIPDNGFAMSNLDIMVVEEGGEVTGIFRYNNTVLERSTVETFRDEFLESVRDIVRGVSLDS